MSLLGQQVYANPSKPIWLSADNPVIAGSLTVSGPALFEDVITAEQNVTIEDGINFQASDDPAITVGRIVGDTVATGRLYVQGDTDIAFGKVGQALVNTTLTLGTGGNGDDVFNMAGTLNTLDLTAQSILTNSFSPVLGTATVAGIGAGGNPITWGGNLAGTILQPNAFYEYGMTLLIAESGAGPFAPQEIEVVILPTTSAQTIVGYRTTTTVAVTPNFTTFSITGYLRHTNVGPAALTGTVFLGAPLTAGSAITIRDPFILRLD